MGFPHVFLVILGNTKQKLISFAHISSTNPFWWNKHIDTVCSHKHTDAKGGTNRAGLYLCMFYFSQRWAFYLIWTDERDAFYSSMTSLFQVVQKKDPQLTRSAFLHPYTADWCLFFAFLSFMFFITPLDWKSGQLKSNSNPKKTLILKSHSS